LSLFPVSFFSVVMGLAGITIAFQKAEVLFSISFQISRFFFFLAICTFLAILFLYLAKMVFYKDYIIKEFRHPVRLSFFPTISISMLLLSVASHEYSESIAFFSAVSGASLHLFFTLIIISQWIKQDRFDIKHMNPSWFIPAVGNILVPVAGYNIFNDFTLWFFFSIGFLFWIALFVIFLYRIIFHHPLPDKLLPTLFILIAPPSVGFIAYSKISGPLDHFSFFLYSIALFLFALLLSMGKMFGKLNFYLSWWAYSFPIAALTIATFSFYHSSRYELLKYFGIFLLGFLFIICILLIVKTVQVILKKGICIEED
jgi:tellurite resistance protein